jgi:hypothetical protein
LAQPISRADCSRVSREQQLVSHAGGRSRRREDSTDRRVGALAIAVLLVAAPSLLQTCRTARSRRS